MIKNTKYEAYLPYFILFFFLNNFLLPDGLLYTSLLSPLFLYWLYKNGHIKWLIKTSILLIIPALFHIFNDFDNKSYLISTGLIFTVWIFLFTAIKAIPKVNNYFDTIFKTVLIINSILIIVALIFLPFVSIRDIFWNSIPISPSVPGFPRLKLLAYEPSHYALLVSPVFLFFALKILTGKTRHPLLIASAIGLPLVLSLSFGVLSALITAIGIGVISYWKRLPKFSGQMLFYCLLFLGIFSILFMLVWPENPVLVRFENIFEGKDTSAKGRLLDSFMFSWDLAKNNNLWFGVGPGQIKILAHDFIISYYQYTGEFADVVRIPNSMGEMLATYGLYGFIIKLFTEIYFFIRLGVYRNLYSLILFVFIFIYQFTGSFLTNITEIGIWAIVFQSRFSQFDYFNFNAKAG